MPSKPFDQQHNALSLIGEVSHLIRRNFNRRARDFGLTQPQWRAIVVLRRSEGMNQATLADVLEIQPISLARLIDRMEASGWIERRPNPKDRRSIQLFLSEKAGPILEELGLAAAEIHETATAGLSTEENDALLAVLGRIKLNLHNDTTPTQINATPDVSIG